MTVHRVLALLAALAFLSSGCGDTEPRCVAPCGEAPDTGVDTTSDDVGTDADASHDVDEDSGNASAISFSVGATEETANIFHTVDVSGRGGSVIGNVDISGAVGTVEIHGRTVDAFSYRRIPWPSENRTLYQTLAVAPDDIYVLWFYCSDDDRLREIWFEGTDETALDYERSSGSCSGSQTSSQPDVSFPALDMELESTDGGFEVTGTNVSIGADGTGTTTFFDTTYETYVFDQVDCSVQCNTSDGWYELHALMWNAEDAELFFGIFYLSDDGATVQLSYTIGLPSLFEPGQQQFPDATWTQL
jgi:hypothetical protein